MQNVLNSGYKVHSLILIQVQNRIAKCIDIVRIVEAKYILKRIHNGKYQIVNKFKQQQKYRQIFKDMALLYLFFLVNLFIYYYNDQDYFIIHQKPLIRAITGFFGISSILSIIFIGFISFRSFKVRLSSGYPPTLVDEILKQKGEQEVMNKRNKPKYSKEISEDSLQYYQGRETYAIKKQAQFIQNRKNKQKIGKKK